MSSIKYLGDSRMYGTSGDKCNLLGAGSVPVRVVLLVRLVVGVGRGGPGRGQPAGQLAR